MIRPVVHRLGARASRPHPYLKQNLFHSYLKQNLFHSRMIGPVVGWRETGSKSSVSRLFINIDAQDAQDYLARGYTFLSSTIAYASTGIPKTRSQWITSNTHSIIEPVCFLCSSLSSCLSCLSCLSMFPNTANRINGTLVLVRYRP